MKKFAGFVNRQVDFKDPRAFEFYVYIYIVKDGYLKTEGYDNANIFGLFFLLGRTSLWYSKNLFLWLGLVVGLVVFDIDGGLTITSLWYSKNLLMLTTMEKTRMAMEIIVAVFRGKW